MARKTPLVFMRSCALLVRLWGREREGGDWCWAILADLSLTQKEARQGSAGSWVSRFFYVQAIPFKVLALQLFSAFCASSTQRLCFLDSFPQSKRNIHLQVFPLNGVKCLCPNPFSRTLVTLVSCLVCLVWCIFMTLLWCTSMLTHLKNHLMRGSKPYSCIKEVFLSVGVTVTF